MNSAYRDYIAGLAKVGLTHLVLFNAQGAELNGGNYARLASSWQGPSGGDGTIRPDADKLFRVPAGATVAGWGAATSASGGNVFGPVPFSQPETYAADGEFRLIAAETALEHVAAS